MAQFMTTHLDLLSVDLFYCVVQPNIIVPLKRALFALMYSLLTFVFELELVTGPFVELS